MLVGRRVARASIDRGDCAVAEKSSFGSGQ